MDLTTVKTDLFAFFGTHDTFSLEENFDDLYLLTNKEEKPFKAALIEKALEEYVAQKMVALIKFIDQDGKEKKAYVLEKPLEQYEQSLSLTYPTLLGLTNLINNYCDEIKNKSAKVNPLNVTEKDINSLLLIVHQTLMGPMNNVK